MVSSEFEKEYNVQYMNIENKRLENDRWIKMNPCLNRIHAEYEEMNGYEKTKKSIFIKRVFDFVFTISMLM